MIKSKLFWLPVSLYLLISIPMLWWDIDWRLAHYFYQLEGGSWALKEHWLTQAVLHGGGHDVALTLYLFILLLYVLSFKLVSLTSYKRGLSYLSLSLPVATLTVSLFKRITAVDCPWSVIDFGGGRPYQSWLESLWTPLVGADHCFPAGHASSAYMFFGLYFFSRLYWPRYSSFILAAILTTGITFGLAQQLRGAHFISHDLTSALICWLVNLVLWHTWENRS